MREGHQGAVQSFRISTDGRRLASCGDDSAVKVWDLENGDLLRTLRRDRPYERLNITGVKGLTEPQKVSLRALGAFEERECVNFGIPWAESVQLCGREQTRPFREEQACFGFVSALRDLQEKRTKAKSTHTIVQIPPMEFQNLHSDN